MSEHPVNLESEFYTVALHAEGSALITMKTGSLETKNAHVIKTHIIQLLEVKDLSSLMIEMAQVKYIDSFGLASIISMLKACEKRGGKLALINPGPSILQLIEVTRLSSMLPIFGTAEEAKAYVNS